MNLNSVYKIKENEAYSYIKRIVDKNSIDLAIFSDFEEFYITKKTLFNCMSVLSYDGILIIKSDINKISRLISLLKQLDYSYHISYCSIGVQTSSSETFGVGTEIFVIIRNQNNAIGRGFSDSIVLYDKPIEQYIVNRFSNVQNIVLIIGHLNDNIAICCKNLCRYVICIMERINDNLFGEAIKEYEV